MPEILSESGQTITTTPWNIVPDTTSVMILEMGCSMVAVYGNNLSAKQAVSTPAADTASAGVEPYGNNWDFCVDNNTFTYVGICISNWAQGQTGPLGVQPDNWNLFCNNTMNTNRQCFDQLMGFYSNSGYNPGIVAFGNVFRNNTMNGTTVKCISESCASWVSAGVPIDECIFEHNTATNVPWGVDLNDQSLGSQGTNALFYKNSFTLGSATYGGSEGANIPAGTNPAFQQDTWNGFATTYSLSPPGPILEMPQRSLYASSPLGGGASQATLTIWNSGTSALPWTATSTTASWLTLSPASGTAPVEGSSAITLSCSPSGMSIGKYTVTITISGASQTMTALLTFNVTGGPNVTITAPTTGANYSPGSNVPITATATDATGTISNVKFYQGATLLGTVTSSPYSYTWSSVALGSYTLTAVGTDSNSYSETSPAVIITADTAPSCVLTSPTNNTVIAAPASITCTATASPASGDTISNVKFYSGTLLLATELNSPYSYSWTNVATGIYSVTAKASDNLGCITTSSAAQVTVTAPPTVSITSPIANPIQYYQAPASISLAATASSVTTTIASVKFYANGNLLATETTSPYGFTWTNVSYSTTSIALTAVATDGNDLQTTSATVYCTVSTLPATGLALWVRGDAGYSLDGSNDLLAWDDLSGNGVNLTPANGQGYATWTANAINGLPVARFNGSNSSLINVLSPNPTGTFNVFIMTQSVTTNGNGVDRIMSCPTTTEPDYEGGIDINVPSTSAYAPQIISVQNFTMATGTALGCYGFGYYINPGTFGSGGCNLSGDIAEVIVYNTTLTSTQISAIESYLNSRYLETGPQPPSCTMTAPANGAIIAPSSNITLSAGATPQGTASISSVKFYSGSTLLSTVTSSPYNYTWNSVAKGDYALSAVATDSNNMTGTSSTVDITVDSAPTCSLTAPANNAVYAAPAGITITASASSSTSTISSVTFYAGAAALSTVSSSPYSYAWTSVAAGSYSLTAKAVDALGLSITSSAITVVSDTPPAVSITSPTNNQTFPTSANITITATASAETGATISTVAFYQGGTLLSTVSTSPYSYTWSTVANGSYSLTAKATDSYGIATTSGAVAITVTSNTPPTCSITAPTAGTTYTAPASVTLTASAAGSGSATIASVKFYYAGSTLIATVTSSPYTYAWTSVAGGSYSLTAVATDSNNLTTTSGAVAILVDTPPTVSITAPANNAVFAASSNVTITASASAASGDTISSVAFYQGGTLLSTVSTSPYSCTWSSVAAGSYSLTAKATNNHNLSTTSSAVAITLDTAPTVSITAPSNGATYTAPASVSITASATASSGHSISSVAFYAGGTLLGSITTSPYTFSWTSVAANSYTLTAVAADNLGVQTTSSGVGITVNGSSTTPPTGMYMWFKADAGVKISGNWAYEWDDQSGNGNYMEPTEEPYSPSQVTNAINGLPVIRFNPANTDNYYCNFNNGQPGGNFTIFVVTQSTTGQGSGSTSDRILSCPANNYSDTQYGFNIQCGTTSAYAPELITLNESMTAGYVLNTIAMGACFNFNKTVANPAYYFSGDIGEVLIYNSTLSSQNVNQATNYLDGRWGLTTAPTCAITSPTSGTNFAPSSNVTITATATASGSATISSVKFYAGSALLGTVTTSPYSYTWNSVAAGAYALTAIATDSNSNTGTSAAVAITVDTAPTCSITSPANNTVFAAPASIAIVAGATTSTSTIASVSFYSGATLLGTDTGASPYGYTWTGVASGSYSLTAKATDAMGLSTTSSAITVIADTPPSCAITSPANNAIFATNSNIPITATVTDSNSGGSISSVKFYQAQHAARHRHHLAVHLHLEQRGERHLLAHRDGHRQ